MKKNFFDKVRIVCHSQLMKKLCKNSVLVVQPWWFGGRACGLITDFSLSRRIQSFLRHRIYMDEIIY